MQKGKVACFRYLKGLVIDMKIEKVNENQIRCTLTREDLASRQLKLSELAYGTEKAKNLFREMMQQANFEFGFEAEDIPLMIEAIPLNAECIVLIITKVDDPEELDTRFSRFAPSVTESDEEDEIMAENASDEMLDLFRRIQNTAQDAKESTEMDAEAGSTAPQLFTRVFVFSSLQQVMSAAQVTASYYKGESFLYKDGASGQYILVLTQTASAEDSTEAFDRVCNTLSEYGVPKKAMSASISFFKEHYETLIASHALQALGNSN